MKPKPDWIEKWVERHYGYSFYIAGLNGNFSINRSLTWSQFIRSLRRAERAAKRGKKGKKR